MDRKNRPVYYFAYGSNMDLDKMRYMVGANFKSYQRGVLKDYELVFNKALGGGTAAANIVPKEGSVVEGVLYELEDPYYDYFSLDMWEGYPDHYTVEILQVETEDDKTLPAVVYVAHPSKVKEGLKPTEEYFLHLLEACRLGILSEEYCQRLRRMYREFFGEEPFV